MYEVDKINKDLEELNALDLLAEVFTDIAHARLDRVRAGIERNRVFVGEIAEVLHVVRLAAEAKGLSAARKKKISASLLVTSNNRLYYGSLDAKVIDFYVAHTQYTGYADRFVVGSVGADILRGRNYPYAFEPLVFGQDLPDVHELVALTRRLSEYQKVMVYYPRFTSVLSQQPSFVDITGLLMAKVDQPEEKYYIFEPEIEKILLFFEEQVMAILIEQAMLEAELARIGTQLTTMDSAAQRALEFIKQENDLLAVAKRKLENLRVLEMVTGLLGRKYKFSTVHLGQE